MAYLFLDGPDHALGETLRIELSRELACRIELLHRSLLDLVLASVP